MKKIMITIFVFISIIIFGMFVIRNNQKDTNITKKQTKVGFILNGKVDDKSWGQSHYNGMERIKKELNLDVIYKEDVPEDDGCIETIEELVKDGCEIIICDSFGYGNAEITCAKKYPEVYFFHATGVENASNLSTYFGRIYQMRYLTGVVAGLQTKTNEIGYVAAFPIAEVNRGINAFTLGVRAVNPDAKVYVEWSNSWGDDKANGDATRRLIEKQNIDVLAMHMDSVVPLEIAEEEGIWTIGYNIDNSENFPNTFLTAPVWNWEKFYEPRIRECLQGKFQGKSYWEGVETGIIGIAPLSKNVEAGIAQKVEKENERLESKTFDVFYGPIYDNKGNLKIPEGESMTDDAMLNDFFWYVEGVVIDEE